MIQGKLYKPGASHPGGGDAEVAFEDETKVLLQKVAHEAALEFTAGNLS